MPKRILFLLIFFFCLSSSRAIDADEYKGEKIVYNIRPLFGRAEYSDLGIVDLKGKKAKLVIFKTNVLGFKDTEKIYSDPRSSLPITIERDITFLFSEEKIIEEYDQKKFSVTIKKFKGNKKINELVLTADGPIYNAILLAFYPRRIPKLDIGWSFTFRLPDKFKTRLVSIDNIELAGKKMEAYHFISVPDKFEIWISKNKLRVPFKIKGRGGLNYILLLKDYTSGKGDFLDRP